MCSSLQVRIYSWVLMSSVWICKCYVLRVRCAHHCKSELTRESWCLVIFISSVKSCILSIKEIMNCISGDILSYFPTICQALLLYGCCSELHVLRFSCVTLGIVLCYRCCPKFRPTTTLSAQWWTPSSTWLPCRMTCWLVSSNAQTYMYIMKCMSVMVTHKPSLGLFPGTS